MTNPLLSPTAQAVLDAFNESWVKHYQHHLSVVKGQEWVENNAIAAAFRAASNEMMEKFDGEIAWPYANFLDDIANELEPKPKNFEEWKIRWSMEDMPEARHIRQVE